MSYVRFHVYKLGKMVDVLEWAPTSCIIDAAHTAAVTQVTIRRRGEMVAGPGAGAGGGQRRAVPAVHGRGATIAAKTGQVPPS